jgi:hypothetical protein
MASLPQSQTQSHVVLPCLSLPALCRTTRRPNRWPTQSLKNRAPAICLRRQPQERVCPEVRWQPKTTVLFPQSQAQTQDTLPARAREFLRPRPSTIRRPNR